jgi:selenocysteine lyase/cysteine desulfurase
MINFDNAATTFPKPATVRKSVEFAIANYGNSGRGGHSLSMSGGQQVFSARFTVGKFFGAEVENVVFTSSATAALNFAIKGVGVRHIIISSMEHNSVSRPIVSENYSYDVVACAKDGLEFDDETVIENFMSTLKPETNVVAMTAVSNVTGRIMPFRRIGEICRKRNICFIVDASQAAGIIPLNLEKDNINIICCAGHKGLYGLTGTGLLVSDGKYPLKSIIQGGTGTSSLDLIQPDYLPESLESGTLNIPGIISVRHGIEFVLKKSIENIFKHESTLCRKFIENLPPKTIVYRTENVRYAPIVSFNIPNFFAEDVAAFLNKKGFALRAGLHCAALTHTSLGTLDGTVRFAPSIFNTISEAFLVRESLHTLTATSILN